LHENVRNLEAEETSILSLYKALIGLRRRTPALIIGDHEPITAENDLLIYRRRKDSSVMVVLNFAADPVSVDTQSIGLRGEILLSTFMDRAGERISGVLDLRGNEGVVASCSPD
jgi:alpha-glucosidase